MPPVPIPLPLSSAPGGSPQESAGRLINCFAEPLGQSAGAKQAWHRSPGLSLQAVTGRVGYRGGILANNLIYAAIGTEVVSINAAGVETTIGDLAGSDPVIFAHNNKAPTADIVAVDSDGAFLVLDSRTIQPNIAIAANAISNGDLAGQAKENAFDGDTTTEWESSQTGSQVPVAPYPANVITASTWAATNGGQATFTTTTAHGVKVGSAVQITGSTPVGYNGTWNAVAGTAGSTLVVAMPLNPGAISAEGSLAAGGGAWIGQDFGSSHKDIVQFNVFQANAGIGNIASAIVEYSADLVTWTAVDTFTLNSPSSWQILTWASVGAKRAWRLRANDNPGSGVAWGLYELQMSLAGTVAPATVEAYPDANLPTPNSVWFQDGYLFFTIGDRRVFASVLNDITINALTYTTLQSRPSQSAIRGVSYKGVSIIFTTSSAEVWSDTAQPYPGFPYSRLAVIDRGLLVGSAIAGDTEGFGHLLWVGDDFGVYRLSTLFQEEKVSSPDLDRLIEAQAAIDPTQLFAGCYIAGGRSMWTLSSPDWTWEFNNNSEKWNERSSFYSGLLSRWRGIGGLKAFGRWIVGDDQTGNLAYVDPTNFAELDAAQLFRIESGPAENFPNRIRVGRTDIDIATGAGQSSGATVNQTDPVIMISYSDDGGVSWTNPMTRSLGEQARADKRVWATSLGRTGAQGRRWRYDVSDPVYVGLLGATMDANARAR